MRANRKGLHQTAPGRAACLLAATAHLAAAPCPLPEGTEEAQPAAVHVVWGPLPPEGDPRVVHHLEHVLLNDSPSLDCLAGEQGVLSAFTGPDTLHILWRGMADPTRAAAVAAALRSAAVPASSTLRTGWASAADEIVVERLLGAPSDSEKLLQQNSPSEQRYRLHPRGPVRLDPDTALDTLHQAAVTTVTAIGATDVEWRQDAAPPRTPAHITAIEHPVGAAAAWQVVGTLDCSQRRALRAVLAGMAEVQEGTMVGWMGHSYGVMGIQTPESERTPRRRIVAAAHAYDQAATRMTARRLADPADRTWMGVGHLGLGVCPSTAERPLTEPELRTALGWLLGADHPPPGHAPPPTGSLSLVSPPRAAIWQAGAPPLGWDAHPSLFHTRTPGGFVLEGERAALEALVAAAAIPPTTGTPVPLDDPVEQGIVLAGAQRSTVPCRWSGLEPAPACPPTGLLRIPGHHALFVVEDTRQPTLVQVDIVYALDGDAARQAADALLGTGGPLRAVLDRHGTIRDTRVIPEHSRSRLSFTVPATQLADVLEELLVDRPTSSTTTPTWVGPGPALDAARQATRPFERAHHPEPTASLDAAAVAAFDQAPRMVMLQGSAEQILPGLERLALHPDRILRPVQLRAEATSIQLQP